MNGEPMADETKKETVTLDEFVLSSLAMTDALAKLLIAKGVITDEEFKTQLTAERANYLAVLKRLH
jgi:mannitol/fructose-specific phosphotransferase system IIA component (Ntr-type)